MVDLSTNEILVIKTSKGHYADGGVFSGKITEQLERVFNYIYGYDDVPYRVKFNYVRRLFFKVKAAAFDTPDKVLAHIEMAENEVDSSIIYRAEQSREEKLYFFYCSQLCFLEIFSTKNGEKSQIIDLELSTEKQKKIYEEVFSY